jgi:hypothetical protein
MLQGHFISLVPEAVENYKQQPLTASSVTVVGASVEQADASAIQVGCKPIETIRHTGSGHMCI